MNAATRAALERIDALATPDDWVTAAACRGLVVGYAHRWAEDHENIRLEACEIVLTAPLMNVATARRSRTFDLGGKLDKIVQDAAGRTLYDHKTTSDDISDPAGTYWRQLAIDSQASHYELLALANDLRVDRIVWDVTRKPGIRPKHIAGKDYKQTLADATYCGFPVSAATMAALADNPRENGELYAHRVARDAIDEPDRYFARRSVPRTREQLAEYCEELWEIADAIRSAKNTGHHYRNSGACMQYGRACEFLGVCAGSDSIDSDHWRKKPLVHGELGERSGGLDLLTNSRLKTFQTCRRKHYYAYELGIERAIDDQVESLFFGSLWHEALDVFWQTLDQENRHGHCSEQSSRRDDSRQAEAGLAF